MTWLKRLVYPLYIYPRTTKGTKKKLHELFQLYRAKKPDLSEGGKGLKLFSNMEEDGIILKLLASIYVEKGFFLDIGSNDCINSNCANLAFNFDWEGVFIDANAQLLKTGKRNYKRFGKEKNLKFVHSFLFPENINEVVNKNVASKEIDFASIDIDGNDYAIWKALDCVKPKIVVVENKIEYGKYDIVVPAINAFFAAQWGASIVSISRVAQEKGYTLVATNKEGFNAFYMRNDCLEISGLQPLSIETVLNNDNIKASFYPENKMIKLIQKVNSVNQNHGVSWVKH